MHLRIANSRKARSNAFALVEVVVAMAVGAVVLMALYLGISGSFRLMGATRENLRATQIMVEKLEAIRLYNWGQLTNTTFLTGEFVDFYYPGGTNLGHSPGSSYHGEIFIEPVPFTNSYSTNMRMVTVRVTWTNGTPRIREMSTFVSQHGLQRYLIQ